MKRIIKGWRDGARGIGKDVGIVIGRFQPFHKGHEFLIKEAVKNSDYVIVLIGSAKKARDFKNPWPVEERAIMLYNIAKDNDIKATQIRFEGITDFYNNDMWLKNIKAKLRPYVTKNDDVTLYGYIKDESSFYLQLFPEWKLKEVYNPKYNIDATRIRDILFLKDNMKPWVKTLAVMVPKGTLKFLENWVKSEEYAQLCEEYKYTEEYRNKWKNSPYEPTFTTVDAVVTYKGKVHIIERKAEPGNHLLSLPGGFIDSKKNLLDNIIKITEKKTNIRLEKEWLTKVQVIDDPRRSLRGRIITHVHKFEIPYTVNLNIKGNFKGEWMDFDEIEMYEEQFFEDHAMILKEML